jgi:hypothetical protein
MAVGIYATKSCLVTLVFAATITVALGSPWDSSHDHVNEMLAGG